MIDQIGLLDEDYFMYMEDVDLCLRAKKNGWKVVYFPLVTFVHHVGKSTSQDRMKMQLEHHRSMYHFYRKHYKTNLILKLLVFFGILSRLFFVSLGFIFYRRPKSMQTERR